MPVEYVVLTGLVDEMIDPRLPKSTDPPPAGWSVNPTAGLNAWLTAALAAEPDDAQIAGDLTKRGPVTRGLAFLFGQPRMLPSQAAALLPLEPGDPNPFFPIVDAVEREGGDVQVGSGPLELARCRYVTRAEWLQPGYAAALVMTAGDAFGLLVYTPVADMSADVPANFPNRVAVDGSDPENPVESVRSWADWIAGPQAWETIAGDGVTFVPLVDTWNQGQILPASTWLAAGLAVVTRDELDALLAG